MSPLKSFKQDAIPPGDLGLIQKLEEVQTSIMVLYVWTCYVSAKVDVNCAVFIS